MDLQEYLNAKENRSMVKVATLLGVSRQMVYNYASGANEPSLKIARRIQEVTKGQVTLDDWPVRKKSVYEEKPLDNLSDLL